MRQNNESKQAYAMKRLLELMPILWGPPFIFVLAAAIKNKMLIVTLYINMMYGNVNHNMRIMKWSIFNPYDIYHTRTTYD